MITNRVRPTDSRSVALGRPSGRWARTLSQRDEDYPIQSFPRPIPYGWVFSDGDISEHQIPGRASGIGLTIGDIRHLCVACLDDMVCIEACGGVRRDSNTLKKRVCLCFSSRDA